MKNLITITALIAAGAIAANAETNLEPGANFSGLSWNQLDLTTPGGSGLTGGNSGFNWDGEQNKLTDSWSLLFKLDTSNTSGKNPLFSTSATTGGAVGLVLTLDCSDSASKKIELLNGKGGSSLGQSITFASGQNVMLTFLKYDEAKKTSTSKAGKFVLSIYDVGKTTTSQNVEFEVDSNQSDLIFLKDSTGGSTINPNTSRLWTNGGKETFSNIKLAYGSAIPEPSSFGLLAGLGALALVGARRRRSRK